MVWKRQNIVFTFKMPLFQATTVEQHVANWGVFVAHFYVLFSHFGILEPNFYYEIEHWKSHNFLALCCESKCQRLTFMKSTLDGDQSVKDLYTLG